MVLRRTMRRTQKPKKVYNESRFCARCVRRKPAGRAARSVLSYAQVLVRTIKRMPQISSTLYRLRFFLTIRSSISQWMSRSVTRPLGSYQSGWADRAPFCDRSDHEGRFSPGETGTRWSKMFVASAAGRVQIAIVSVVAVLFLSFP